MGNKKNPKDDLVNAEEFDYLLERLGCESWEELSTLEELTTLRELEEGPHFDCVGGKEAFFLYPKTASANLWISENFGISIWEIVGYREYVLPVVEEDVVITLKAILEDGLSFSKTLH